MKNTWLRVGPAALAALCLLPVSAVAHTGSGSGAGFGHPPGGLDHLLAVVVVGLWAVQLVAARSGWCPPPVSR